MAQREKRKLPKRMSDEQVQAILAQPDISTTTGLRDRVIMEIMLQGGLRVSEVVALRRTDIDRKRWWLEIRDSKGGDRTVTMPPSSHQWLRLWDEARWGHAKTWFHVTRGAGYGHASRGEGYGTHSPLSVRTVQVMIARHREEAGLPSWVTPHSFRHTFATRMVERGINIVSLKQLLGHRNVQTTMIYTHLAPAGIAEEVRRIDQAAAEQQTMEGTVSAQAAGIGAQLEAAAERRGKPVEELTISEVAAALAE